MSDRGGWGARTAYGMKVTLNVYDLSPANEYVHPLGLGVFHTGLEIGDKEYTFAGGAGIFDHSPREPGGPAVFREAVELGFFEGGQAVLQAALSDLGPHFPPEGYHILTRNCNHLSDALSQRLLNRPIPGYVNRLANLGGCVAGCLPQQLLDASPVGGPSSSSGQAAAGAFSGFSRAGGGGRRLAEASAVPQTQVFSGRGMSLGGGGGGERGSNSSSSSSSNSNSNISSSAGGGSGSSDQLYDRRERTRQARLARLGIS